MQASRRTLLGGAAFGASGLIALATPAQAETDDKGAPGQGGFGRKVQQLPPGAKVAYHNPADVAEMPKFRYSLDGSRG